MAAFLKHGDVGAGASAPAAGTWLYYVAAALILAMVPAVPYPIGSGGFFASQATLWAIASYLVNVARKNVWESAGMADCQPERRPWPETAPAWAFEASFLVQLVNVPFCALMTRRIFSSWDAFDAASKKYMVDFPQEGMWTEHVIFASLFGFMVRDFFLHWRSPDPLIFAHHVCVMIIMYCCCFHAVPGVQLLAWMTPTAEIGTSAYCAWVVWRMKLAYQCTMHFSNIAFFLGVTVVFYNSSKTYLDCLLTFIGYALIVGRTDAVFRELRKAKAKAI